MMTPTRNGHPPAAHRLLLLLPLLLALAGPAADRALADPGAPAPPAQYDLDIPGLTPEMLRADHWIAALRRPDEPILSPREIEAFNRRNAEHCETLADPATHPRALPGPSVRERIERAGKAPDKPLYRDGKPLGRRFLARVLAARGLERIPPTVKVRFGVTVRRTEMRAFPAAERVFSEPGDFEFDRWIETTLYPLEPLAILHESLDGAWFFAQARNYRAWVAARDVALGAPEEIFPVLAREPFLVVTGKTVFTGFDPLDPDVSEARLDMGVRLPLARRDEIPALMSGRHPLGNHVVMLPSRDRRGRLVWKLGLVSFADDVSVGYLPYTRRNILRQAFKFLGERYGWGGMFHGRDCSSFIHDVHRTMGLLLPRNAGEQGRLSLGRLHAFTPGMTLGERIRAMERVPPATPVYMDGHAMLYLDRAGGDFFILHDFIQLRTQDEAGPKTTKTRAVFVTPLLRTYLSSGKSYLEGLYGAREFK